MDPATPLFRTLSFALPQLESTRSRRTRSTGQEVGTYGSTCLTFHCSALIRQRNFAVT